MRALFVALLLVAAPAVFAQNTPPTEDSVRHLLDLMQTHRIMDDVMSNMDAFMRQTMDQARQGQTLNAQQQQIVAQFHTEVVGAVKDELAWSKIEPDMVAIWQRTFSQKEINDLSAFYSSPSGQAIASKLPLVAQAQNAGIQRRMMPLLGRIRTAARDMEAKLRAAGDQGGAPPSH